MEVSNLKSQGSFGRITRKAQGEQAAPVSDSKQKNLVRKESMQKVEVAVMREKHLSLLLKAKRSCLVRVFQNDTGGDCDRR